MAGVGVGARDQVLERRGQRRRELLALGDLGGQLLVEPGVDLLQEIADARARDARVVGQVHLPDADDVTHDVGAGVVTEAGVLVFLVLGPA